MLRLCFASGDTTALPNCGIPLALLLELILDVETYRFGPRKPDGLAEETDGRDPRFPNTSEGCLIECASSELDISPRDVINATCPCDNRRSVDSDWWS